jgi:hypothetical protein
MDPIDEIKTRLKRYPDLKSESDSSSITVMPASDGGFSVSLAVGGNGYIVSFNGWHENFEDPEVALECFAFGLSSECRLKEYRRGGFAYRWAVESKENGEWIEDSETGLLLFPFWRKRKLSTFRMTYCTESECFKNRFDVERVLVSSQHTPLGVTCL